MPTKDNLQPARLTHKRAIINFTYSFSWDVTQCGFEEIAKSANAQVVVNEDDILNDTWLRLHLFNRPVQWADKQNQASYHPNIISQNLLVLHRGGLVDKEVKVVLPINKDTSRNYIHPVERKVLVANLHYALRIFENGSGNCTFTFMLDHDVTFEDIHCVLHLASSISHIGQDQDRLAHVQHLTYGWLQPSGSSSSMFFNGSEQASISDLFGNIIASEALPPIWREKSLWFDSKVICAKNSVFHNWQSPFVLTLLETDRDDFEAFEKWQHPEHLREVGSIACRFSLDNSRILADSDMLKREYIFNSFGFYHCPPDEKNRTGLRLKNYSHHSELFYTIGKRGAIAMTPDFSGNPSYFVLPTFLNLIEILRSRWHLGSIVNLKLDELLETISHTADINELQDRVFRCKVLYGLFLKNPAPYLFDGGAITDIAEAGEEIFWLRRLSMEMERKFVVMESLLDDIYSRKKVRDLFG